MIKLTQHITEDYQLVTQYDAVWEIWYKWLNWEVSLAYPVPARVADVPAGCKVWRNEDACRRECHRRNNPTRQVWL